MQHCTIVGAASFFSVTLAQPLATNNVNNAKWLWSALRGWKEGTHCHAHIRLLRGWIGALTGTFYDIISYS